MVDIVQHRWDTIPGSSSVPMVDEVAMVEAAIAEELRGQSQMFPSKKGGRPLSYEEP